MNTKMLLRIAATSGAFVLVGGISVAALARSGAGASTPPKLPVVSTPEVENDATETPGLEETESPEADNQGENEADDDQGENDDDQGENDDDQGENEDSEDSDDDSDD
jgi:hypothetical protein